VSTSDESPPSVLGDWQLADADLLARLKESECCLRQVQARQLAILTEVDQRGLAATAGCRSTIELQAGLLGVSHTEGKRRMERVRAFTTGMLPSAQPALDAGEISVEHVDHLIRFHDGLSDAVHPDTWTEHEPNLVEVAKEFGPLRFRRALEREVGPRLDPDGYLPKEKELAEPYNRLSFVWQPDGRLLFNGELEHEVAVLFAGYLDPHMVPRKNADGTPDLRSTDERRGDAMATWIDDGRDAAPIEGGERAQVTVTVGLDQLLSGLGTATLGPDLLPISVSEARRLACDCRLIPVTLSAESMPLEIGRASRTIPPHIRRLVVDRDQHCAFPDCVRPATQCQVHHLVEWQHGGDTELPNLALLCKRHHRMIHHSDWEVRMNHGRPEFLPPAFLDPRRRPRTNRIDLPPPPR
jgi:hypothetical protein